MAAVRLTRSRSRNRYLMMRWSQMLKCEVMGHTASAYDYFTPCRNSSEIVAIDRTVLIAY